MTYIPPSEKIIETKKCRLSGKEFFVTDKDIELLDKVSPVFGDVKYSLPTPTLCPDERQKRRLSFRNERKMYKRKCDLTGKEIISIFSPDKEYTVYDQHVWWSDDWNPGDYARKFDFERTFFDQFRDLFAITPKISLYSVNCTNSDYTNFTINSRDCYLCVGTTNSESVLYSNFVRDVKNGMDSTFCYESELIYYGIDLTRCYNCFYAKNSVNCRDCFGIEECESCHHCIGCYGLKNKEYHVFNQPISKESFEAMWKKGLERGGSLQILSDLKSLRESRYVKNMHLINCENCYGDQAENGKNGFMCFDSKNIENARYTYFSPKNINCIDITYTAPTGLEYCGECCSTLANNCFATFQVSNASHVFYSIGSHNSEHIFGCSNMKKGKYAIMNASYSVQEYETLCGKIIDHMRSTGEWGEYFPTELSTFGYNETVAQEYFPMTKEEVRNMPRFEEWRFNEPPSGRGNGNSEKTKGDLLGTNPPSSQSSDTSFKKEVTVKGWKWYDGENKNTYIGGHYSPLPIEQYDEKKVGYETAQKNIDDILSGILECEVTRKPFKIIKQELVFYIENGIPIPIKHPDQRHFERMSLRNPRELHERICPKCRENMITTYRPDRPERVVCEECYRKLVY